MTSNDGSSALAKFDLYTRPFLPEEHGFVGGDDENSGNAYILKSALRRRLTEIDKKWRLGTPQLMAVDADLVVMTGELIVEGASRCAVGTGKIATTKNVKDSNGRNVKDTKTGQTVTEPLSLFELTREKNKAYKSAASDLLPRLCLEYNIGAYLKEMPKTIRTRAALVKWLDGLKPKVAPPPATTPPPPPVPAVTTTTEPPATVKWQTEDEALIGLAWKAFDNKWIEHRGAEGVKELEAIIAPKTWDDFTDRPAAALYIKQAVEDTQAEIERQKKSAIPRNGNVNVTEATIEDRTAVFTTKAGTLKVLIKNLVAMLEPNGVSQGKDDVRQRRWLESVKPGLWQDGASVTFPELRLWFTTLRETNNALHVSSIDVAVDIPNTNGGTPPGAATFPPADVERPALANPAAQSNGAPATQQRTLVNFPSAVRPLSSILSGLAPEQND